MLRDQVKILMYEDYPEVYLKISSYRAVNTLHLGDKNQSGNDV